MKNSYARASFAKPAATEKDEVGHFEFRTSSRDDLFQLGYILADGLPDDVLQHADRALLIAIDGSWKSGKKIIPDAMREKLFEDTPRLSGKEDFDERWFGHHKSRDLEFDFLNAAWGMGYSDLSLRGVHNDDEKVTNFQQNRKDGGLTFVHNNAAFAEKADISIEIKKNSASDPNSWERNVAITVRDPRLLASPEFMTAVHTMPGRIAKENSWLQRLKRLLSPL